MEKSFLDKQEELLEKFPVEDEDDSIMEGRVTDDLDAVRKKMKEESDRKRLEEEAEEEAKRIRKDRCKAARRDWFKALWQNFLIAIHPDTYAGIVQNFEGLLFVIFVDTILLTLLFSVLYGVYIIFTIGIDNWFISLFKFGGTIIIAMVCIIIQMNIGSKPKSGE